MPHISYADVPLLLEDPEHTLQCWIDTHLPLIDRHFFGGQPTWYREGRERSRGARLSRLNGHETPNVTLPVPNYSTIGPPQWKLSSLWWPTGAARHSVGLFLASDAELAEIMAKLTYTGSKSAELVIDEGSGQNPDPDLRTRLVCSAMYLLPPLRITSLETPLATPAVPLNRLYGGDAGSPAIWLLCLVDQRYFWPFATTGNLEISPGDTWEDIYDHVAGLLNTTITYDDVPDAYGDPDPVEIGRLYEDPAMLLDAIAHSVGQRIVFGFDSSVGAVNYLTSNEIFLDNAEDHLAVTAGGMPADWRFSAYPENVRILFPVRNFYQLTLEQGRNVDIAYTDVFDDEQATQAGSYKVIYTTALADFSGETSGESADYLVDDPENLTGMEDLAEIIADDYYGYISAPYDVNFPGVFRWVPEGFNDWIWFHAGCQRRQGDFGYYTRIVSHAPTFGVTSQLSQLLDPVLGIVLTPCGDGQTEDSVLIMDTRDKSAGELLSEETNRVAMIFGNGFTIESTQADTRNAIYVQVTDIVDECPADSTPGESTSTVRFELLEDMARSDVAKKAVLIDDIVGGIDGGAVAYWTALDATVTTGDRRRATAAVGGFVVGQIIKSDSDRTTGATFDATEAGEWSNDDGNIYVIDPDLVFYGYAAYTDPSYGATGAYRGLAYKVTENYNTTGWPGYVIKRIESTARWIEGVVAADTESAETAGDEITYLNVDRFWGAAPNNRAPKTEEVEGIEDEEEDPIPVVAVYDTLVPGAIYTEGTRKRAIWDDDDERYIFVAGAGLIGASAGWAKIIGGDVPAMIETENDEAVTVLRVGVGTAVPMIPVVPTTPYAEQDRDWVFITDTEDPDYEEFEFDNMCGDDLEDGKYIQWKTMPGGRRFVDTVACFDPQYVEPEE